MKKGFILFFIFLATRSYCQNEFAADAFYNDFKKIVADAVSGFPHLKGEKKKNSFEELSEEYHVKLLLPLSDSGKIVFPLNNHPYVIYYFEPEKVRLKVDQRSVNLMEAVIIAYDRPLYSRMETSMVNDHPFTHALYFISPDESRWDFAVFRTSIYFFNGKYHLSLAIVGKRG